MHGKSGYPAHPKERPGERTNQARSRSRTGRSDTASSWTSAVIDTASASSSPGPLTPNSEARDELSRIRHEQNLGTYVKPSNDTVNQLPGRLPQGRHPWPPRVHQVATTRHALTPVRERLGDRPCSHHQGRHRGPRWTGCSPPAASAAGKPGTGSSGRSARLTLGRLTAALEMAVLEGKLVRNVARLVTPPEHIPGERETWKQGRGEEVPAARLAGPAARRLAAVASTACAGAKSSACAGQTSISRPRRSRSTRPGYWSSTRSGSRSRSAATASARCPSMTSWSRR